MDTKANIEKRMSESRVNKSTKLSIDEKDSLKTFNDIFSCH